MKSVSLSAIFSICIFIRAFAIVETIASAYAIEQGQKIQFILSAQQLISCDYNPRLNLDGCKGGALMPAFATLRDVRTDMHA